MKEILEIKNLTKRYPGVVALDSISLSFKEGEVHALVGENGSGKSTLIKSISGAVIPDEGSISFTGKTYNSLHPKEIIDMGIGVIYQEFNLVPSMTVAENIFLGEAIGGRYLIDRQTMNQKSREIFERFHIAINPSDVVRNLSTAKQQIVEIAKAISKNVKLLIMDEPTATLANNEVDSLFEIIRELKRQGTTIVFISHRFDEVFEIADRITILRDGKLIHTCNVKDVTRDEIITKMVGREIGKGLDLQHKKQNAVALEIKNLCGPGVKDVSLKVNKGEILGVFGLVGSGRTETAKIIYGARKASGGEIYVNGEKIQIRSPEIAIRNGIGLIPEDRKTEGVFLNFSIRWNTVIMILKRLAKVLGFVPRNDVSKVTKEYFDILRIKAPNYNVLVKQLSGGNQQKVVLAKTLAIGTNIVIFDEPTRGIDIGARQEIYKLMDTLAEEGAAIIMITSDMEELLNMSDRIAVMHEGTVFGEIEKEKFDQEGVLRLASGIAEGR